MPGIHPMVSEWEKGPMLVLHIDSPAPIYAVLLHSPHQIAFRVGLFKKPGLFKPEQSWIFEVRFCLDVFFVSVRLLVCLFRLY